MKWMNEDNDISFMIEQMKRPFRWNTEIMGKFFHAFCIFTLPALCRLIFSIKGAIWNYHSQIIKY